MNAQAKKLASPILGVPLHILHMVEILKEPIFVVLMIRPCEFEVISRECHRVKRECHHISSNSKKKLPLEEGSKRWFWKPMSSRLPYLLDKHFDGRPKYKSCWVEFLNSSKENLFLDYKCILAIYKKGILITDTLHKVDTLSLAVQRLLPT